MAESLTDKHRDAKRFIRLNVRSMAVDDVDWAAASDPTDSYNCMGFAMGHLQWWEPSVPGAEDTFNTADYWPDGTPHSYSIEAYVMAAETRGFAVSPDAAWEEGFETIAFYYAESDHAFKHVARQKSPGVWESKLGQCSDIEHPFAGVDCAKYGTGRVYMKRPWPHRPSVAERLPGGT